VLVFVIFRGSQSAALSPKRFCTILTKTFFLVTPEEPRISHLAIKPDKGIDALLTWVCIVGSHQTFGDWKSSLSCIGKGRIFTYDKQVRRVLLIDS
jgi:hypothetical protein